MITRMCRNKWILILADIAVVIAAGFSPAVASALLPRLGACYFARYGLLCPSCGGTRCVYNLFTGRIVEAFACNAAVFCVILYGLLLLVMVNIRLFSNGRWGHRVMRAMVHPAALASLLGVYILYGILRNIL